MANTVIQLKKSATPSATPSNLANGELALNYADGKLYYKAANGAITAINATQPNNFGTVNANNVLIVADSPNAFLSVVPGNNISIVGDAINDKITVGLTNDVAVSGLLSVTASSGDEGGEIRLANAITNSLLAGPVNIDIYQNKLRFFVGAGDARGAFINLAATSAGVGTDLLAASSGTDAYARTTANQAFDKANAALPNVSGASFNGNLTVSQNLTSDRVVTLNNGNGENFKVGDDTWIGDVNIANALRIKGQQNASIGYVMFGPNDGKLLGRAGTDNLTYDGNTIWHAGIDGAGSGLDADLLDGQHGSYYGIASDVTASFLKANTANITADRAWNHANAAFISANIAFANANTVMVSAQAAFTVANSGFLHANASYVFGNSAHSIANLAFTHANNAYLKANNALANTTGTFAGTLTLTGRIITNDLATINSSVRITATNGNFEGGEIQLSGAGDYDDWAIDSYQDSLRFFTTSSNTNTLQIINTGAGTVNMSVDGHATIASMNIVPTIQAAFANGNTVIQTAQSAFTQANLAFIHANNAFASANAGQASGNAGQSTANASYAFANSAHAIANLAFTHANNAYNTANNALPKTGGTVTGDVSIVGKLTVNGNVFIVDSETLKVSDPLIYLAGNNYTSDIVDIGFVANYVDGAGQNVHTGIFRDATVKEYYIFEGYNKEPNPNHIDTAANNFTISVLNATLKTSNIILGGANAIVTIGASFDQANTARTHANQSFEQANTVRNLANSSMLFMNTTGIHVNTAFTQANTARIHANLSFDQANTAETHANLSFEQANTARIHANVSFEQANTARVHANLGFDQANTAETHANLSFEQANTARIHANQSFEQANTVRLLANASMLFMNTTGIHVNTAFAQANTARIHANLSFEQANTARTHANQSFEQANTARIHANNAYFEANNALANVTTRATYSGNLDFTAGGISFGSRVSSATTNVMNHIDMWGTLYGFSITDSNLNGVVPAGANVTIHVGGTNRARVNLNGLYVTGGINSTSMVKSAGLYDSSNRQLLIKDSTGTVVWGN